MHDVKKIKLLYTLDYEKNGTFIDRLDKNTNLIRFNDGVYDIRQQVFRNGYFSDYLYIKIDCSIGIFRHDNINVLSHILMKTTIS